jgi:hypothetical protein
VDFSPGKAQSPALADFGVLPGISRWAGGFQAAVLRARWPMCFQLALFVRVAAF